MRPIPLLVIALLLGAPSALACSVPSPLTAPGGDRSIFQVALPAHLSRVTLSVQGLSCQHDVERVTDHLFALPGVAVVAPDTWKNRVEIAFDPGQVSLSALTDAIAGLRGVSLRFVAERL